NNNKIISPALNTAVFELKISTKEINQYLAQAKKIFAQIDYVDKKDSGMSKKEKKVYAQIVKQYQNIFGALYNYVERSPELQNNKDTIQVLEEIEEQYQQYLPKKSGETASIDSSELERISNQLSLASSTFKKYNSSGFE